MLKLTVGTMIALTAAQVLGVDPQVRALRPQPAWVEWGALLTGVLAFAVLFRAARRDYPLVMVAAMVGYLIPRIVGRSEEHTSELQSLMRISYAVFCLKKK